jgi:hypothetical protein
MVVAGIKAKMATQKDLNNGLKISSKSLVDVEWLDACAHMNVEKIKDNSLMEWLCPTHTFGKVVAQNRNVMCIATNVSNANGLDMIAVPIKWIKKIKILEAN